MEKITYSTNDAGKTSYLPTENEFVVTLSPCVNRNSEWIKGFNLKLGMLILDVKGNYYSQVKKYVDYYRRQQDLIIIELRWKYQIQSFR